MQGYILKINFNCHLLLKTLKLCLFLIGEWLTENRLDLRPAAELLDRQLAAGLDPTCLHKYRSIARTLWVIFRHSLVDLRTGSVAHNEMILVAISTIMVCLYSIHNVWIT